MGLLFGLLVGCQSSQSPCVTCILRCIADAELDPCWVPTLCRLGIFGAICLNNNESPTSHPRHLKTPDLRCRQGEGVSWWRSLRTRLGRIGGLCMYIYIYMIINVDLHVYECMCYVRTIMYIIYIYIHICVWHIFGQKICVSCNVECLVSIIFIYYLLSNIYFSISLFLKPLSLHVCLFASLSLSLSVSFSLSM